MRIRKLISAYRIKLFGSKLKLVKTNLLGKDLTVFKGTVDKEIDKDDAWFFALSQNHKSIYDVGANIGYTAILASVLDSNKTIVLVDPNPNALCYAAENLIRNNFSINKVFIPSFVAEKSAEKVKFYTIGIGSAGSMFSTAAESAKMLNSYYWVNTLTIDDIVLFTGIIPDLLKIDVEGAESLVLKGATKLAAKQKAKFIVEMHASPEMTMQENAELILEWCNSNYYMPYYLKEHCIINTSAMIAHRGRCHLLLIPKEEKYPEYLMGINENSPLPNIVNSNN